MIEQNLTEVINNIEKARLSVSAHHIVKVVAVSKYTNQDSIQKCCEAGQRAFGESKVQDLKTKSENLSYLPIQWHFIGNLQKNKINHLIDLKPYLIHSIDSYELAKALDDRLDKKGLTQKILLQTDRLDDIDTTYSKILENCKNISLEGIMSIGVNTEDKKIIQKSFESTYQTFETLKSKGAKVCSMGMSGDYELAIKCGSNMVRIGSKIFNKNP
jgi:pyridoxal phosphate enzyme (YggS family)